MCLLVVAWLSHPRYRLVVAGTRDEFHDRPSAPLGWWSDVPGVLAGRDLRANGTWMGVARGDRFGIVTNFRSVEAPAAAESPSRGQLVPHFLREDREPGAFLEDLRATADQFAGFNLLLGDSSTLHYYSNAVRQPPRALPPGIYGLSNHQLDEPWPKLVRTRQRFAAELAGDDPSPEALFDVLADRAPATDGELPATGLPEDLERALSAPFVRHDRYGTRCSTLAFVEHDGRTRVLERRFDAAGAQTGSSRFEFRGGSR
jgi:uncharacterized protein with NRDE domain